MKHLLNFIQGMYKIVIVIFTALLFLIVAYNVASRYLFNNSIVWADELSRFIFIWMNLLGMISVFQNDELVKLDIFSARIRNLRWGKNILDIIEFLFVGGVLLLLTFYSFQFISIMNHVSASLVIPMKIVYSILPISMSFMFIGNIVKFINIIKNNRRE